MDLQNCIINMNLSGRIEEALLKIIDEFSGGGCPSLIGEVRVWAGASAPSAEYLICDGSQLDSTTHPELFAIIGTTYGGVGTTFNLPDLRDKIPVGAGSTYALGATGGTATNTIGVNNLPAHTHGSGGLTVTVGTTTASPDTEEASGAILGQTNADDVVYSQSGADGALGGVTISGNTDSVGGGVAVNNMQPFTGINYIIALQGVFPSRS